MRDRRLRVIQHDPGGGEEEICWLLDRSLRVVLPQEQPPFREQLLALTLVDLLARLFPRIEVVTDAGAPPDDRLPPGAQRLGERLEAVRAHGLPPAPPSGDVAVTVAIGSASCDADVYVDASGWQSYVGTRPARLAVEDDSAVPVGALVAACRCANQVFQRVLGDLLTQPTHIVESSYSSALTYKSGTEPFDDPALMPPARIDAVLVGAGSIGGAAAYLLARTPGLAGELHVVDDEVLAEHNPDRAILATETLAAQEAVKVDVVRDALAHHRDLDVHPHKKRFETFVAERPREDTLPLVLSAVDSIESRREIQDGVPYAVIDAACGPDQVSCSGHLTGEGPCLYCLHIGDVLDSTRIKYRLIAQATGLPEPTVVALLVQEAPLTQQHLEAIETHRRAFGENVPPGAYAPFLGVTLETLYRERFVYGEARVETSRGGQAAVAAPFVTALAGFLLAGEALKGAAGADYAQFRLGPSGQIATMYREDPWQTPANALQLNPPRWPGLECLCRSPLRLRLLAARYGL